MGQNILDMLGGPAGIAQMAREMGVDPSMVQQGATALLPAVLGGFRNQVAAQPQGLEGLMGMLGGMGGGALLDSVLAPQPTPVAEGNAVLGQIFGSKDVSRTVATQAATQTGVSADLLKKMLPMVAMAAAGFMSKQASAGSAAAPSAGGGLGGLLGQVMGGLTGSGGQPQAGGMGGLMQMLDANGDGNPLDDIMRLAQGMRR